MSAAVERRRPSELVAIAGAGPVGLLLALELQARGLPAMVFERRRGPRLGSRSIGVHPPSLDILERLGIVDRFIARGVRVTRGLAFSDGRPLGRVDFGTCAGKHRYVLAIPQEENERILEETLLDRSPRALQSGEIVAIGQRSDAVTLSISTGEGAIVEREHTLLVGCDGKRSTVREAMGAAFDGDAYEGGYAMADFPDTTSFGSDAAIFLGRAGLVECFPLPGRMRRWVVRSDETLGGPADSVVESVARTARTHLDPRDAIRASYFRAEHFVANSFARGRIVLAGDAAHVVSPIGGQGMNLGWLGAHSLAEVIATTPSDAIERALRANGRSRARVANAARRRAELNMWLGRPAVRSWARDALVGALLRRPVAPLLARVFTMRGLWLGV